MFSSDARFGGAPFSAKRRGSFPPPFSAKRRKVAAGAHPAARAPGRGRGQARPPVATPMHEAVALAAMRAPRVTLNPEQARVVDAVARRGENVVVTGPAGTGKTVVVTEVVRALREADPNHALAVTAPTGAAAALLSGSTIHSFYGIPPRAGEDGRSARQIAADLKPWKAAALRGLRTMVIDEVSMVSPALFDVLEGVARVVRGDPRPFGGIQLVAVGDFLQLPPVAKRAGGGGGGGGGAPRFAFQAKSWARCFPTPAHHHRLVRNIRQAGDGAWWGVLCRVREGAQTDADLELVNARLVRKGDPPLPPTATRVYTHNKAVDAENAARVAALPGRDTTWKAPTMGRTAAGRDAFDRACRAPASLSLRTGTVVAATANVPPLHNGMSGVVVAAMHSPQQPYPRVDFGGEVGEVVVEPHKFTLEVGGEVRGWRVQVPLAPAFARTVHRVQGATVSGGMACDLSRAFEAHQAYTTLSRVPALASLHLLAPLKHANVQVDAAALAFERGEWAPASSAPVVKIEA